jgi:hypothetical protein
MRGFAPATRVMSRSEPPAPQALVALDAGCAAWLMSRFATRVEVARQCNEPVVRLRVDCHRCGVSAEQAEPAGSGRDPSRSAGRTRSRLRRSQLACSAPRLRPQTGCPTKRAEPARPRRRRPSVRRHGGLIGARSSAARTCAAVEPGRRDGEVGAGDRITSGPWPRRSRRAPPSSAAGPGRNRRPGPPPGCLAAGTGPDQARADHRQPSHPPRGGYPREQAVSPPAGGLAVCTG